MALLQFKRSAVSGKAPTVLDLDLGELAINTYDGKIYTKKDDGIQSIVEIGGGGGGTVTSVAASGGTTGLTFSGSPITTSGTITLGGTLAIANGGTGATTASTARANLSAAVLGANGDITSLTGITGGISSPDFVQFDTAATVTPAAGRLYFNDGEGGLSYGLKGGNVIQEVGQSQQLLVYNGTGAALTKGQVVYSNGAQGQRPTVALALATSDATSARTIGIVAEPIANGAEGWVSTFGIVENIDTLAFSVGAQLYLSGTVAGGLTATKPYAPVHMVYVARCIKSHATAGRLFVTIQNGYEMDELHNVSAQSPSNNDGLFYNTTTSLWETKSIITALGYTPYNATNPNGYTNNTGTVTSVSGTGTVSGLTLTGTVTTTGSLTLGGTLSLTSGNVTTALGYTPYNATNPNGYLSTVSLTTNVTGTLPIGNGGTGATTAANALTSLGAYPASNPNGYTSNTGTVTGVTGTAPIVSSGGTAPAISISAATTIAAGSMSATDKTKLDGIATNANNYVLPKATATSLGGVEVFDATVQTVAANAVTTTASRTYGIQLNAADQMVVNVPWTAGGSGTVTSVSGTGTVNGITLTGTVTSSGSLTLGGTLSGVSLTTQVSGTLPVANGGTGVTTSTGSGNVVLSASPTFTGTVTTATTDLLGSVRSNITAVAASAIDCSAGNYFTKTAAGALTWTATNIPASRAFSFLLELTNGGTGTQTWFTGTKWPNGTAPTLTTSGVDMLGFVTDDGGTTWRGVLLMKDSK